MKTMNLSITLQCLLLVNHVLNLYPFIYVIMHSASIKFEHLSSIKLPMAVIKLFMTTAGELIKES